MCGDRMVHMDGSHARVILFWGLICPDSLERSTNLLLRSQLSFIVLKFDLGYLKWVLQIKFRHESIKGFKNNQDHRDFQQDS